MAKVNRTVRVELSDDDLTEAVRTWAHAHGIAAADGEIVSVAVDTRMVSVGYGMSEGQEPRSTVVLTIRGE